MIGSNFLFLDAKNEASPGKNFSLEFSIDEKLTR
jgi:hypothetical protein